MNKVFIGYQGNLPVRIESSREAIEKDKFFVCDSIVEYVGRAELVNGKVLFDDAIDAVKLETAYQIFDSNVEKRLNDFAATRRYSSINSACSYSTSTDPTFRAEGEYCVQARDATYRKCYDLLAEYMPGVLAGKRPIPTWEEIEAQLPPLVWPDEQVEADEPDQPEGETETEAEADAV